MMTSYVQWLDDKKGKGQGGCTRELLPSRQRPVVYKVTVSTADTKSAGAT